MQSFAFVDVEQQNSMATSRARTPQIPLNRRPCTLHLPQETSGTAEKVPVFVFNENKGSGGSKNNTIRVFQSK